MDIWIVTKGYQRFPKRYYMFLYLKTQEAAKFEQLNFSQFTMNSYKNTGTGMCSTFLKTYNDT